MKFKFSVDACLSVGKVGCLLHGYVIGTRQSIVDIYIIIIGPPYNKGSFLYRYSFPRNYIIVLNRGIMFFILVFL